jgi:hypothetical protein
MESIGHTHRDSHVQANNCRQVEFGKTAPCLLLLFADHRSRETVSSIGRTRKPGSIGVPKEYVLQVRFHAKNWCYSDISLNYMVIRYAPCAGESSKKKV